MDDNSSEMWVLSLLPHPSIVHPYQVFTENSNDRGSYSSIIIFQRLWTIWGYQRYTISNNVHSWSTSVLYQWMERNDHDGIHAASFPRMWRQIKQPFCMLCSVIQHAGKEENVKEVWQFMLRTIIVFFLVQWRQGYYTPVDGGLVPPSEK